MTIEVEVDGQVYSGSSVMRVKWRKNDPMGATHGPSWISGIRGEAAFVEIPERGVLFALMSFSGNTSYAADLPTRIMTGRNKGWARGEEEFTAVEKAKGQILTVTKPHYPLLVTFEDITDSQTIKVVDPANLTPTFGPGVSLKRVTLEITDEPVTREVIEQVLPWFYKVESIIPRALLPRYEKDATPEQKISLLDFVDGKTFREKRIDNKR